MAGKPMTPEPVCSLDDIEHAAKALFRRVRALPHSPVSLYLRQGEVYALSQRYRIEQLWSVAYPEDYIGQITRMERPEQIAAKLLRAVGVVG